MRPTSGRVREALFSLVGHDLAGVTVLDAFGGAGLLALEAWSRGAAVVVVERDPAAVRCIRSNLRGLGADVSLLQGDVLALAPELGTFDLVLVDPPYATDPEPILHVLASNVSGRLVLELDAARPDPVAPGLRLDRRRTYGSTALCVFVREPA